MMTPIYRTFTACTLALLLAACPGGGDDTNTASDPTTTGASDPTTTGASDPTTTGEPTTTDAETTAPTTSGTTTDAVDPCDACDANASCEGDECVCDEGFDGDGASCEDIDECAGKNDCAVDATCSNTPGSYDCACNAGYKGNGETCTDVDECNEDLDNCSVNADCTNQDGAFKCECKDGFNGDGIVCNGSKEFGDPCKDNQDCASGLCLTGGAGMCTISCTQAVANDCGAQNVTGLCIQAAADIYVCAGDLTFGTDKDDEVMVDGDTVKRPFQSTTDADVFLVNIAVAGDYTIVATPDPDDDLQVEFYDADASELGKINMGKVGEVDGATVTAQAGGVLFVVVRNIGNSNGNYSISVTKA